MRSPASRTRKRPSATLALIAFVAVAIALGTGWSRVQAAEAAASSEAVAETPEFAVERGDDPFADRFPNVVLKTHEGRNVRFYDDLLKDKIVLINFMYATCTER